MKVSRENGENQQIVLTIEAPAEEWDKAVAQAAKRIAKEVNIPGFRRGKAPRHIIEQRIGKEALIDEAYEKFGPQVFDKALAEEKLELASYPDFERVQAEEGKPFILKATITPKPEVTLGEYKGLKIEKKVEEVTDETVDQHIDKMRDRKSQMVDAPEGSEAKMGDLTTIDFKGFVDGEAFEGGEGNDYPLRLGSGSFIPGFEDQLVGMKVGEERDVKVTFPENYHSENLSGKEAVFHCKLNKLKNKVLPELNDEFVQQASIFKTVDELKKDVREKLEKAAESKAENDRRVAAIDKAAENASMDIPEVMVEDRIDQMLREFAMRLEQQGMKFEQYLQLSGGDMTKLRDQYRETAEKNVRTDLMLEAVAKAENIEVSDEDIRTEIAMMAQLYNATPAQVQKIVRQQGRLSDLAITVMRRKTAKFIVDHLAE
ncbi:MAG: trigger factor [Selenomonadaceae bacterium]|jgi:trigger factor|nr:trigger factor [Selenomonadaceae bacterium]